MSDRKPLGIKGWISLGVDNLNFSNVFFQKKQIIPVKCANLKKKRLAPVALVAPCVITLALLGLYPFFYAIFLSLHYWQFGAPLNSSVFVGLSNYIELFHSSSFWNSIRITGVFVVSSVLLELLLGLGISLLLTRAFWGGRFIRSLVIAPMAVTPVVVGLTWRVLFNTQYGIINFCLNHLHLPWCNWIAGPKTALFSVIIVDIWQWTPFVALILLAGLETISKEVTEAAQIDGASPMKMFWYVTLPLIKPSLLIALLFRTMDSFKVFDNIFALTMGGPGSATETLSMFAYIQGFRNQDMGSAAAVSLILLIIVTIICQTLLRLAPFKQEESK